MAVITVDTLVEGVRRDDVFAWLSDPSHHEQLVRAGFDEVETVGPGVFRAVLRMPGRPIGVEYRFEKADDTHGGRRVLVHLGGKRTAGEMHWSLRTMKPSTNTLVTLHADYKSGRVLGPILDALFLQKALEKGMSAMLDAVQRDLPR